MHIVGLLVYLSIYRNVLRYLSEKICPGWPLNLLTNLESVLRYFSRTVIFSSYKITIFCPHWGFELQISLKRFMISKTAVKFLTYLFNVLMCQVWKLRLKNYWVSELKKLFQNLIWPPLMKIYHFAPWLCL